MVYVCVCVCVCVASRDDTTARSAVAWHLLSRCDSDVCSLPNLEHFTCAIVFDSLALQCDPFAASARIFTPTHPAPDGGAQTCSEWRSSASCLARTVAGWFTFNRWPDLCIRQQLVATPRTAHLQFCMAARKTTRSIAARVTVQRHVLMSLC